jgi:hypothetical protein
MYAITPQPQDSTPAPSFSLATLRAVVAEMEAAHPERAGRIVRAANIVAVREIEATASGTYWVQSEVDPTKEYWVCPLPQFNVWRCTCKDFQQRGGPCKHALAVQILQACEAADRGPEPPPPPLAFPTRHYRDDDRFELTPRGLAAVAAVA